MTKYVFEQAPLEEVIFAVDFAAPKFSSTIFGLYWKHIEARFPISDQERIPFVVSDQVVDSDSGPSDLPPARRVWFESADKDRLIQLQQGRFMFNWRRQTDSSQYPEFEAIFPAFLTEWRCFESWYGEYTRENVRLLKLELSYINTLDAAHGWRGPADAPAVLTFLSIPFASTPKPSVVYSMFQTAVPELGDLYVITRPKGGAETSEVNRLELRVIKENSEHELSDWFQLARQVISQAFLESTTESAQALWGRKEKPGVVL